MSSSTFQSYKHRINSIFVALSSVITLTGNVNFSDNLTGLTIHPPYIFIGNSGISKDNPFAI